MKNFISYFLHKNSEISLKKKLFTIGLITFIPVAFLHEFYHFIFVWLFNIKHKLYDFEILKFHKDKKYMNVFNMTYEILGKINPYKLIIVAAAPYIGLVANVYLYFLICIILNLKTTIFFFFLLYHSISMLFLLPSNEDRNCINKGIKEINPIIADNKIINLKLKPKYQNKTNANTLPKMAPVVSNALSTPKLLPLWSLDDSAIIASLGAVLIPFPTLSKEANVIALCHTLDKPKATLNISAVK